MSSLFDKKALTEHISKYDKLSDNDIAIIKNDILSRWNKAKGLENEIQHQHNFLQDFFCKILGYTGETGNEENTLWWESGTNDGRRPDGILGFNLKGYKDKDIAKGDNINAGDIRVVIELKGSDVDLDRNQNRKGLTITPVEQGFLYAPKVGGKCEFVIVSNFKEIRLYKSTDANKYHSFIIEELANDDNKIKEFHYLLSKDNLFRKNHNQSPVHSLNTTEKGEEIEKRFYKHYSTLREEIWHNLTELNKDKRYGRNFYLYKAQKLIDRIIFIRFCKENGALDNDAVLEALSQTLIPTKYERLKYLFMAMDKGRPEIGIAKFNGGLFATDPDLDCLTISDEIIDKIVILYSHDFGSDLDVNILGHIFEQSISDLENLTGDNEKKRKKDGVFYTPAYITEYIVKEAIGGWLADRKAGIKAKEGSKEWWKEYAEKLKSIKVLDPACGSGAFLVKVFDYLQSQWREVEKHIQTEWTYKDILTHNIYGVDINPASTGITKLSLWLKTAHHREPLTTLDGNIKIGNSLIDNEVIAGYYSEFEGKIVQEQIDLQARLLSDDDKNIVEQEKVKDNLIKNGVKKSLAFNWAKEFPFKFDVVVGNPPYVRQDANSIYNKYYKWNTDLYLMFYEKVFRDLIKNNSFFGFIVPRYWTVNQENKTFREYLLNEITLKSIAETCPFEGVDTENIVTIIKNCKNDKDEIKIYQDLDKIISYSHDIKKQSCINNKYYEIITSLNEKTLEILNKIVINTTPLNQISESKRGMEIGKNDCNNGTVKTLIGSDVNKYSINFENTYITESHKEYCRLKNFFDKDLILLRRVADGLIATLAGELYSYNKNLYGIKIDSQYNVKFILALLNSNLMNFYYKNKFSMKKIDIFPEIQTYLYNQLPIPQIPLTDQQPFVEKAQTMLALTKQLNELSNKFLKLLSADLGVVKITKKLERWYNLETDEFFAESSKQNKNLSLSQKSQWLDHFEAEKQKALALQNQITKTDAEIDKMVYALYGLSEEEIGVVEGLVV